MLLCYRGAFISAAVSLIIFGALWYVFFYRGRAGGSSKNTNLFGDNNPFVSEEHIRFSSGSVGFFIDGFI
jgi:hypothetical protein